MGTDSEIDLPRRGREDGGVPRLDPPPGMPANAQAAADALSAPARVLAIRFLKEHPESSMGDLAAGTGMTDRTARHVLSELDAAGYVITQAPVPSDKLGRRPVRYSLNRDRLAEDLLAVMLFLT